MLPTKRPRGRPRTGSAISGAERQAKYRAKQAEKTVTVTFNRQDMDALKLLLSTAQLNLMSGETLNVVARLDLETLNSIIQAVFMADIEQGR